MITAADAKNRLLGQLEAFLSYLLPSGKVEGHEYRVGDVAGTPGHSLAVQLKGDARGVWQDFATGDKGDIFDLYCQNKNLGFKEAFPEICRYLGLVEIGRPTPKPKPPKPPTSDVSGMTGTKVLEYLNKTRGLTPETLKMYGVRSHRRNSPHNVDFICFQFSDSEGVPVMLKSTGIKKKPDGGKDIWSTEPYYTLWGWWLVKPECREILITEGEIDAMSVFQMGAAMPVLSVPSGASNLTWIENDWTALQRFERIYLCFDTDEAGEKAAVDTAKRLGLTRCFRIKPPGAFKDANECLTKGEPEDLEVSSWLSAAKTYDPPTIRSARELRDETRRLMLLQAEEAKKSSFVFPAVKFSIRNGETTLITGRTSHGKSEICYQTLVHEMRSGHRVCILSCEIPPAAMLRNIATQLCERLPSDDDLDKALAFLDGKLWFFIRPQDAKREDWSPMFADFTYCVQRFGCDRFLVDSLIFLTGKEDYDAQDRLATSLHNFDVLNNTHSFLIAHASEKKAGYSIPGQDEISGSGGLLAPFDNILIVYRYIEKEDRIEKARQDGNETEIASISQQPDGLLIIAKQRLTGERSKTKLWFNRNSRTFRTSPDLPPPLKIDELPF
jgi:twinkle protein